MGTAALRLTRLSICIAAAAGHGYLLTPLPRQLPAGQDMSGHQDFPALGPCKGGLPAGPITLNLTVSQAAPLEWTIVIVHTPGFCSLRWARDESALSYDGSTGALLWSSSTCGDALGSSFTDSYIAPSEPVDRGVMQVRL